MSMIYGQIRMTAERADSVGFARVCALLIWALAGTAQATEDAAPAKHLGVVTCSGSTCHGAPRPLADSKVMQNEFITWHRHDAHSRAYRALLSENGQRIARNLGLDSAAGAPECLICHTNYAPAEARGKRFQLSDGVACEACHGPASGWLGTHVTGEASREDNLKVGMYPTEEPVARAKLCLSCHLGTAQKFATHRIMGAGHPRLSFELDTFTQLQPAHYRVDEDYRSRKHVYGGVQVWAVGQVIAASRTLDLFRSGKYPGTGAFPEFAFFDCHACHHPMRDPRWAPRESTGLGPGTVRLNDANMLMLLYLTKHIDGALAERLHGGLLALHRATTESMDAARAAAGDLQRILSEVQGTVLGREYSPADMRAILKSVVAAGANGEYRDYGGAEQAVMAMSSIVAALKRAGDLAAGEDERLDASLKALYATLEDENAYQPARLIAELNALASVLP